MSTSERDYMAEDDARTLSNSHEIMSDSKRHKNAAKAAQRLAKEKEKEALAMNKVAEKAPIKKSTFKGKMKIKW